MSLRLVRILCRFSLYNLDINDRVPCFDFLHVSVKFRFDSETTRIAPGPVRSVAQIGARLGTNFRSSKKTDRRRRRLLTQFARGAGRAPRRAQGRRENGAMRALSPRLTKPDPREGGAALSKRDGNYRL